MQEISQKSYQRPVFLKVLSNGKNNFDLSPLTVVMLQIAQFNKQIQLFLMDINIRETMVD